MLALQFLSLQFFHVTSCLKSPVDGSAYLMMLQLLCVVLGGLTLYFLFLWARELLFYSKNGWDFSKESGLGFEFGDSGVPIPTTPQKRLFFGYPLLVTVSALVFVAIAAIVF